jgi:hypothetical protein
MLDAFALWTPRHWRTALVGALGTALLVGIPTDVIPNPVFGRPVPVTWWSYPVLIVTAVLGGLLLATYVRTPTPATTSATTSAPIDDRAGLVEADDSPAGGSVETELDRPARLGGVGGLLSFFAVGCPVCNKLVVIALGTVGARQWFEPIQPYLAAASIVLMAVALRARLRGSLACAVSPRVPEPSV